MSKGMALPVEYLVILVIAVVVLLAVIVFFFGGWQWLPLDVEKELNKACPVLYYNGCNVNDDTATNYYGILGVPGADVRSDTDGDGTVTVAEVCNKAGLSADACARRCNCPGY